MRLPATEPPLRSSLDPLPVSIAEITNTVAGLHTLSAERPTRPDGLVPLSLIAKRPSRRPTGVWASGPARSAVGLGRQFKEPSQVL